MPRCPLDAGESLSSFLSASLCAILKKVNTEKEFMASQFSQLVKKSPGIMTSLVFLILAVVNAVIIFGANLLFPSHVVLGTFTISPLWAIVLSSSALALLSVLVMPLAGVWEHFRKHVLTPKEWMGSFLVLNFVFVWLITRIPDLLGLGVSSWFVVLILAVVLDLAHGVAMMQLEKLRTA